MVAPRSEPVHGRIHVLLAVLLQPLHASLEPVSKCLRCCAKTPGNVSHPGTLKTPLFLLFYAVSRGKPGPSEEKLRVCRQLWEEKKT